MSWDDFKTPTNDGKNEKPKEPVYRSTSTGFYYSIFRIGKKFKDTTSIKGFERHMEREQNTPNANSQIKNEILIGSPDIYNDVANYIQGIKLRSNNVIARELLLTASPQFFRGLPEQQLHAWKEINKEWLIKNFGDNVRYAVLHKDKFCPFTWRHVSNNTLNCWETLHKLILCI